MTLCDAVNDFRGKLTRGSRDTRYCTFASPEETVGVIDLSAEGDGSRGIAFLTDRIIVKLGADAQQMYYRNIRVTEILPGYETPFEDELVMASPTGSIRISDCGLNKFFLRQLINTLCRMSNTMKDADRDELEAQLTAEALEYYGTPRDAAQPQIPPENPAVSIAATAAVQEIAAAKKAAMAAVPGNSIEIPENIQWISGKHDPLPEPAPSPAPVADCPDERPDDLEDMTREQTMDYLLSSIAEINSEPDGEPMEEPTEAPRPAQPEPVSTPVPEPEHSATLTREPDSPDIYIIASRRIRELCEDGRLTMEQVNSAVKEQLVSASEVYSALDANSAALPPLVRKHAAALAHAADHLTDYFSLGEDIAARVMFFMLYQMLSYTDRIVQSDETKQRLNYFFVRFGAAGMILSMLDANN